MKLDKKQKEFLNNPDFLKEYLLVLNSRLVYSNNLIEKDNGPIDLLYSNESVLVLNDNAHALYISNDYRKIDNKVTFENKYPIEKSSNIEKTMKNLLKNYYGKWSKPDIFEREALFNIEFLRMHPFEDGNGRTSRLILNYNMLREGYAPILIPEGIREEYFHARNEEDVEWIKRCLKF